MRLTIASRLEAAALMVVLLAALILRARHLGSPTLTGDEWFMLRNAREGPLWIIEQARVFEPHPLLYYLGFWAWVGLSGSSEWAMRYPSVLFGVLTCAGVWRLGRDAGGPVVALGGALLAAVNPYQVAQSQNARNYAMVAALTTVASGLLIVAARRDSAAAWLRYAVGTLTALHTHLNAILTLVAHVVWIVVRGALQGQRPSRRALVAGCVVGGLFLPWLAYAAPALGAYRGFYPEQVGPADVALRTLGTFSFGQHEPARRLLVIGIAGLALLGTGRAIRRSVQQRARTAGLLLVLAAGIPIAGAAALFLFRPMFEERYLIVAAPPLIALIAFGAGALGRLFVPLGVATLLALAIATVPFLRSYYPSVADARPDWRALATWIDKSEQDRDVVLVTGQGVADAYGYYGRASAPVVLVGDPATAQAEMDRLVASRPTGVFHLPYWNERSDVIAHERLVASGYAGEQRWFRNQRAQFFAMPAADDPAASAIGARWRDSIELVAASVAPSRLRRGLPVRVGITWLALAAAPDLKVSLRMVDPTTGASRAQLDRRPVDETRPFPTMMVGEQVRDGHALATPADVPPGRYVVALLLYMPDTAAAVAPIGPASANIDRDLVRLGEVVITE